VPVRSYRVVDGDDAGDDDVISLSAKRRFTDTTAGVPPDYKVIGLSRRMRCRDAMSEAGYRLD
jgi:hypothetical protein